MGVREPVKEDRAVGVPVAPGDEGRYASITTGEDEIVLYDRENERAWIQSSVGFEFPIV